MNPSIPLDIETLAPDSIERRMLDMGMSVQDLLGIRDKFATIRAASICGATTGLFSLWLDGKIDDPAQAEQAAALHASLSAMPAQERELLAHLIIKASALGKPAKMGQIAAAARAAAGPLYGHVAMGMLDAMALSMAHSPKPISELAALIAIVGRAVGPGHPPHPILASGVTTRCCYSASPDLLACVLAHGASPGGSDSNGHTPLTMACRNSMLSHQKMGDKETRALRCVETLLAAGADPNEPDRSGQTPLAMAAAQGFHPACHMLLDAGADPFGPSSDPKSTLLDMLLMVGGVRERALAIAEVRALSDTPSAAAPARRPRSI